MLEALDIKVAVKVMKRYEEEREVAKQINLQFEDVKGGLNDYKEALALIQEGQHPFLNSYISTISQHR